MKTTKKPLYNFPVMDKAKKEREKIWKDFYGLEEMRRREEETRRWEKEWARILGEDQDDYF